MTRNPFTPGTAAYIAYERGYSDALDDATKILEDVTYGGGDHEEERACEVPGNHQE